MRTRNEFRRLVYERKGQKKKKSISKFPTGILKNFPNSKKE